LKISNETKVGSLALIAVALLVLGFNYLKGTSLFDKSFNLYAEYDNIDGLTAGNKILINGMQVGQVNTLTLDPTSGKIRVDFSITQDIGIPDDSRALIFSSDLLGSKAINLILGTSSTILKDGGIVVDSIAPTLNERIEKEVLPLKDKIESALNSIDSFVYGLKEILSDENRDNITISMRNLKNTTGRLDSTMVKIDQMMLSARSILKNFDQNKEVINKILANTGTFSDSLAQQAGRIRGIITNADASVAKLQSVLQKIDTGEGSLGLLVNDKELYHHLNGSAESLDSLLIDLRKHPKRYVHFSIFGAKDKVEKKK
jgi:phospholipid/cholesterol/gamma-HCH transport system substrate-binding protein